MRVLTDREVLDRLRGVDLLGPIREASAELAAGGFNLPQRLALDGGALLVMTARHRPSRSSVTKVVQVNESARPRVAGLVVWLDGGGGQLLVEAGAFTALRTAAVSAVAAQALSPLGATTLVVLGAGPQAEAHIRALVRVRALEQVWVVSRTGARAEDLAGRLDADLVAQVRATTDLPFVLRRADLVCCTTTSSTPLFSADQLASDVHVCAVGSHRPGVSELPAQLLAEATLVVVDQREAALAEAGEVVEAVASGAVRAEDLVELADLARVVGPPAGRTVFKSVGVAAHDWAVAAQLNDPRRGPAAGPGSPRG